MQKSTEGSAPHADSGFLWDVRWIYEELGFFVSTVYVFGVGASLWYLFTRSLAQHLTNKMEAWLSLRLGWSSLGKSLSRFINRRLMNLKIWTFSSETKSGKSLRLPGEHSFKGLFSLLKKIL